MSQHSPQRAVVDARRCTCKAEHWQPHTDSCPAKVVTKEYDVTRVKAIKALSALWDIAFPERSGERCHEWAEANYLCAIWEPDSLEDQQDAMPPGIWDLMLALGVTPAELIQHCHANPKLFEGSPSHETCAGDAPQPILVREIVFALEREVDRGSFTDPRWLAAGQLREMPGWLDRTLMCRIDTRPSQIMEATSEKANSAPVRTGITPCWPNGRVCDARADTGVCEHTIAMKSSEPLAPSYTLEQHLNNTVHVESPIWAEYRRLVDRVSQNGSEV
jgi:hypothetical protein